MPDLTGHSLGRYHILEQLGEGGMAVVYKAFDTRLETEVAVKVIRTENILPSALDLTLKRFEREAKALARLTHPNIVKVTDYGEHEGKPYLVMPLLSGGNLKSKLTGKPILWQDVMQTLIPIADALGYAHKHDIIHRDVKPANILISEDGQPMLADFGVAKILEVEETMELTGTGVGIGTPEYMAPEQVTNNKLVDARADIYALGIVMFEMVTGRKPYIADTPMAVLIMHSRDPLPRPKSFVQNLPQTVENILLKALAKNPTDRYQTMAEFAKAMEGLSSGKKVRIQKSSEVSVREKHADFKLPSVPHRAIITVGITALGLGLLVVFHKPLSALPAQLFATPTPTFTPTFTPTTTPTETPTSTLSPTPTITPDTRILNPANQHKYLYVKKSKTWYAAKSYCEQLGGYLVTIQDDAENTFVYNLSGGNIWLGAIRDANGGAFQWVTGEPWNFTKWHSGSAPSDHSRINIHVWGARTGIDPTLAGRPKFWEGSWPDDTFLFVCEWEPVSP
jgi:serine/threonine protein kinase